ncbi:MAG: hypothetical protein KAX65_10115 [Caldilineaceae bacterium]|nr:hypothetical protein [Caldilineaceae bacterium]
MTFAATIRDLSIIMVALESFVIMAMLGILIWQVYKLVKVLQTEIRPIMQDTQETLATLRGTTNFMAENVVNPVVETSSKVAGYRRTLQVLAGSMSSSSQAGAKQASAPSAAQPPASPTAPASGETITTL